MRRASLSTVLLSMLFVVVLAAPALAWQFGVVDTSDRDSQGTSLAIDKSAKVYVAWEENGGDDLWWANWTGSAWSKTQVRGKNSFLTCYGDTNGLGYPDYGPSAGFRPDNGKSRIASACSVDIPGQDVYWTYKASNGTWVSDIVGSLSGAATNVDMAFEPSTSYGNLVVGDRRDADVTWIHWDGSKWVQDVVESGTGGFGVAGPLVSIAFNPITDEPAVVWTYRENASSSLTYAAYDSVTKTWAKSSVVADAVGVPSLAFAPDGTPWIAFQEGTDTASHLEVASKPGASWSLTNVDSTAAITGVAPSAAFTGSKLRVAYYDKTNGNLRWAALGGTWSLKTLESTNDVGDRPSLAFNSSGSAYISYHDHTKKDVRWARPS